MNHSAFRYALPSRPTSVRVSPGKRALLGVVALGDFMNRYNDSLATVTDAESADWAALHLGPLGRDIGRHVGADHEQRTGPPGS